MNSRKSKGVKSWVLYWENMPGHPLPIALDNEVVAVLPPSWGEDRVKDVLERLYLERAMTAGELLTWRNRSSSPYPAVCATYLHGIQVTDLAYYCGHNPILTARKVEQLAAAEEHELTWVEVGVAHHSSRLCEAAGMKDCPLVGKKPNEIKKRGFGRILPTEPL